MARQKPILSLLERLQMYLLQRFSKKRLIREKWHGELESRIFKIFEKYKELSAQNIAQWAGAGELQVSNMYGTMYRVNIDSQTSSCNC